MQGASSLQSLRDALFVATRGFLFQRKMVPLLFAVPPARFFSSRSPLKCAILLYFPSGLQVPVRVKLCDLLVAVVEKSEPAACKDSEPLDHRKNGYLIGSDAKPRPVRYLDIHNIVFGWG
jgi:hypothetical protein